MAWMSVVAKRFLVAALISQRDLAGASFFRWPAFGSNSAETDDRLPARSTCRLGRSFGFIQAFFVSVLTRLQIGDIGSFEWEIVVGLAGSAMTIGAVVFAAAGFVASQLDRRILQL